MDIETARNLFKMVTDQPPLEGEVTPRVSLTGERYTVDSLPATGSSKVLIFDTENMFDAWARNAESFTVWPGEGDPNQPPAELNNEIFDTKPRMVRSFKDSQSGDPRVYQNSDREDGLGE